MWVKHLSLRNFRGFESLSLSLDRPVTVLVGANGSGKTSVLRAIAAPSGWIQSLYNRRTSLPSIELSPADVRLRSAEAEIELLFRHASLDCGFRISVENDGQWEGLFSESTGQRLLREPGRPFLFFCTTSRFASGGELSARRSVDRSRDDEEMRREEEDLGVVAAPTAYDRFVEWFKEREDIENARRVAARDFAVQDPQLAAVRRAVETLVPTLSALRMDRERMPPSLVATKAGVELSLSQLSDGERNLAMLAGDIARRVVLSGAIDGDGDPLGAEFVVLIDEVEQHLHPAWQRKVLPALQRVFPHAQWIVTTHSPQVLSSVSASSVIILDGAQAIPATTTTQGRDTNAILRAIFGVAERPDEEEREVRSIIALIDSGSLEHARARLSALAARLSEADDAVLTLRTRLDFAEAGL
jgi:predicted ATP-binding protein involved in virulence